ncbi:MAG: carboxypeptidase-like regulatory domain-containing protein [Planctomycetaceae bacterium]|nr:carboxypeptidase-like regulatory domain-containing protein [Planctomycetaceae bacterium]
MKRIFFGIILTALITGAMFCVSFIPARADETAAQLKAEAYISPVKRNDLMVFEIRDETGRPVAGAECKFTSTDQYGELSPETSTSRGTTDAQGRVQFSVNRDALLAYSIHAKADNGRLQKYSNGMVRLPKSSHIHLTVPLQQNLPEVIPLNLQPAQRWKGQVVDHEGKPVADASVDVQGYWSTGPFAPFGTDVSAKTRSDTSGMYAVDMPSDIIPSSVYALKDGQGFDYLMMGDPGFPDFAHDKTSHDSLPTITLSGADPLKVRLVDTKGKPVPGLIVTPSSYSPRAGMSKFRSLLVDPEFGAVSDSDGFATINWFSHGDDIFRSSWPVRITMPDSSPLMYMDRPDDNYHFKKPDDCLTELLWKKMPVSGTVRDKSGRPVAGAQVNAYHEKSEFSLPWMTQDSVLTDENGRYEIFVPHEHRYMFQVEGREWVSTTYLGDVFVPYEESVTGVDIVAQKPTRLHGRILEGPDNVPSRTGVDLIRFSDPKLASPESYYKPETPQVPAKYSEIPERGEGKIQKFTVISDENGRYELFLGPGHYRFYNGIIGRGKVFTIQESDENKEIEVDFNITGGK